KLYTVHGALLMAHTALIAQSNKYYKDKMHMHEMELNKITDSMYNSPFPEARQGYSMKFIKALKPALLEPGSFGYEFDSLKKNINIIYSPDKTFRILNWAIRNNLETLRYFGVIQMAGDQSKLYPLIDISHEIKKGFEDSIFVAPRWYGGIIYHIIQKEVDDRQVYFLLSSNAGNMLSNIKFMEPMVFAKQGPVMGVPLFGVKSEMGGHVPVKRFVMEYKKEVQASLNWSDEFDAVVFDRLISVSNEPKRKYTYVPSGQYDGLVWKNNRWEIKQDLIPLLKLEDGQAPSGNTQPRK